MTEPEQQNVNLNLDDMIARFGAEIGAVQGRAVMDKMVYEAKEAAWAEERSQLQKAVTTLNERVVELERAAQESEAEARALPPEPAEMLPLVADQPNGDKPASARARR